MIENEREWFFTGKRVYGRSRTAYPFLKEGNSDLMRNEGRIWEKAGWR